MRITIEEVTRADDLERLRPEWSALWECAAEATVFQSPEWLIPWWRNCGGGDLLVLALREGARLVGLAPFFVRERVARLVGAGESDYLDGLALPGVEAAPILRHVADRRASWDRFELENLRPGSILLGPGAGDEPRAHEVSFALEIAEGVPASMRKKLRYYRRRAAGARVAEGTLEELVRLHRARWAAHGKRGVLADERVLRFHAEAAAEFRARGWLRILLLLLGDRAVAGYYGFQAAGRAYYYLGGFDPEFASLSPGTLLLGSAVEDAAARGATTFDFLRGGESYKRLWGGPGAPPLSEDDPVMPPIGFRRCSEVDLPKLEWDGLFTAHRQIISAAFRRQEERGDLHMLVADLDGFPVGQVWIDFARLAPEGAGFLWAIRVMDSLQGSGIGSRMIGAAEEIVRARPLARARLHVERRNERALRLYERLGYARIGACAESFDVVGHDGREVRVDLDELIMGKELWEASRSASDGPSET